MVRDPNLIVQLAAELMHPSPTVALLYGILRGLDEGSAAGIKLLRVCSILVPNGAVNQMLGVRGRCRAARQLKVCPKEKCIVRNRNNLLFAPARSREAF